MMDRRRFLAALGGGVSAAVLARIDAFAGTATPAPASTGAGIAADGWATLRQVQRHLLPSEPGIPGAADVAALDYLRFVMSWDGTDPIEPALLRDGLARLDGIVTRLGEPSFAALPLQGREQALRTLEASEGGTQWILLVLDYVFEALLADPVYGGNPDGIGWRWLQIQPGFQRPGPDQRYFVL